MAGKTQKKYNKSKRCSKYNKCNKCNNCKKCSAKCKCKSKSLRKMRGGCGCMNDQQQQQQGGKARRRFTQKKKGGADFGPASYTNFDDSYSKHYAENNYQEDPQHMQVASRNLSNMTGGYRKRKNRQLKRGGYSVSSQFNNPITSFMTSAGAANAAQIYSMDTKVDPHTYSQPAADKQVALV